MWSDGRTRIVIKQTTGIQNLDLGAFLNTHVGRPAKADQRAIADYLDRETARIDTLIAAKQRTTSLLSERWRSQRSHAILQGFDPVTGAGVPPARWDVRNLGATVTLQRGHDLPSDSRIPGDVPVVSSGGVSGSHNRAACSPPGVVTGRYGTIGSTYYVDTPYWPLNTTLFVSDFRGSWPRWVFHMLAALPLSIDEEKSAVTGINRNVVGALRVPVPPVAEQHRIANLLDAASDAKDAMAKRVDAQIVLLRERRQALITAAVTGQIKVPVAA
jgi:type I restriction enzyme S subunit